MKDAHLVKIDDIFSELNTTKNGLSKNEAFDRLQKNGRNEIEKKKQKTFLNIFINQFKSPIVYILLVAMVLSFVVKETTDGLFIFIVLICDAILGAVQEWRSNKNAENLKALMKVEASVIREGKLYNIPSEELVLGDIVVLESGSRVPADLRLIETNNLSIDEAILTGESYPREKVSKTLRKDVILNDRINMAYIGTSVLRGRAKGVVIATGKDTEMGKIASEVIEKEDTKTPLQIRMDKFTKQLGTFIGILALLIAFVLYYKNYTTREIFFLVVALSVSAVPEGLPVVITLSLSISSNKMAKKNVLVKRLNAVEALGSSTVIATDKTGTLTLNEQTVKKILLPNNEEFLVTGIGYNGKGKIKSVNDGNINNVANLIKEGVYNNEASLTKVGKEWISMGDSMDIALLALGKKYNFKEKSNIIGRIPYESEEGYSAVFYKEGKKNKVAIKGSLEKVLHFSTSALVNGRKRVFNKDKIREQNESLAREGYRVLAFATGEVKSFKEKAKYTEKDLPKLTFLGLVAFVDPVRSDAKESMDKCREAGIKVVMITGDHPLTAYSVGKELGLLENEEEVTTGMELDSIRLKGESEFDSFIKSKKVFSRVTPLQKYEIVESFKRQGEFIAVTGDGVNDSPALKAANVSVAMGSGTDVAKETGSLIITDDRFSSIVNGVEEGRGAYDNVRKVTHMLLSCGVAEVLFYVLSVVLNFDIPLTAIQLLWLNLVTDGLQDVALAFETTEKGTMKKSPRKPSEGLFDRVLIKYILVNGLFMGLIVFALWVFLNNAMHFNLTEARTYVLILMVFIQNIHCFNCRSEKLSIIDKPLKENKYLLVGIMAVLALQVFAVENDLFASFLGITKVPYMSVAVLFLIASPIIIVNEIMKYFERKRSK